MARGRKPALTLEEQLAKITSEIDSMEKSLGEMRKAKSELEGQVRMNRLAELDELISGKGMSLEEVKALLEGKW